MFIALTSNDNQQLRRSERCDHWKFRVEKYFAPTELGLSLKRDSINITSLTGLKMRPVVDPVLRSRFCLMNASY